MITWNKIPNQPSEWDIRNEIIELLSTLKWTKTVQDFRSITKQIQKHVGSLKESELKKTISEIFIPLNQLEIHGYDFLHVIGQMITLLKKNDFNWVQRVLQTLNKALINTLWTQLNVGTKEYE